jgi:hypothetical protein
MKKELFVTLCAVGLILGAVCAANAGVVTWKILEDTAVAGKGPGLNGRIGVPACPGTSDDDDTATGENNKCNFSNVTNCSAGTTGDPTNGSYSYGALEFVMANSCLYGPTPGKLCATNGECGTGGQCLACADNPAGFDAYFYTGDIGNANGNGTMTMCQEGGNAGSYSFTSFKLGASEPGPGLGAGCMNLTPGGAPNSGSPCGPIETLVTSSVDLSTKILACSIAVGQSDNVVSTGRAYDVNDATPTGQCGYSAADITCLLARVKARQPTAKYVLISCSDMTLPDPSTQPCLAGGRSVSVTVAWTADAANDCNAACGGGGCLMGTAEEAE